MWWMIRCYSSYVHFLSVVQISNEWSVWLLDTQSNFWKTLRKVSNMTDIFSSFHAACILLKYHRIRSSVILLINWSLIKFKWHPPVNTLTLNSRLCTNTTIRYEKNWARCSSCFMFWQSFPGPCWTDSNSSDMSMLSIISPSSWPQANKHISQNITKFVNMSLCLLGNCDWHFIKWPRLKMKTFRVIWAY